MSEPEIDLYSEFFGLTDALTKAEILFAVCGGVAVAIHGYPRFTRDIDLLIQRSDEHRVREVAYRSGFALEGGRMPVGDNPASAWEIARISKVVGQDILALDLLLVGPDIQRSVRRTLRFRFIDRWTNRPAFRPAGAATNQPGAERPQGAPPQVSEAESSKP